MARREIARGAVLGRELGVELEHVRQLVGPREPERAVGRRRDPVVPDVLAEHRGQRLRARNGTWLVAHASPLAGSGQVTLVIEPAKASEIAPIVVEAYGLTSREVDVTRLIARGLSTDEIAATLFLSRHTIRDHLKAIFEKVGVSSRGELTSKLFAEHYHAPLNEAIYGSVDRVGARMDVAGNAV